MPKAHNILWSDVYVVIECIEYAKYFRYVHSKCFSVKTCSNPIPNVFFCITHCFYIPITYSNAKKLPDIESSSHPEKRGKSTYIF